jgi:hypothetical protein
MDWLVDDKERLSLEVNTLKRVYPEVELVKLDGLLRARVKIRSGKTVYHTELVFPQSYPFGEIDVFIRKPHISSSPHRYADKSLCLSHGDIDTETLAVQVMDWVIEWCVAYERYKRTGKWPARVRKSNKRKGRL